MKAVLLVAHPDDEIIFAGGLMLANPEVEWHIRCMTHVPGEARGAKLFRGVRSLAKRGVAMGEARMLGMKDEGAVIHEPEFEQWHEALVPAAGDPDIVFTHNRLGEYGHPHHMACNRLAHEVYGSDVPLWSFYTSFAERVIPQERLAVTFDVDIASGLSVAKMQVMSEAYRHEYNALAQAMPELIGSLFAFGPERFTSDSRTVLA